MNNRTKKIAVCLMSLSVMMGSFSAFAQQPKSPTLVEIQEQLASQKAELAQFEKELGKAQLARKGWITLTVATGLISAITALPGIVSTYGGVQNLSKGIPYLGDPDNGGAFMIPVIIAGTAASAASGYGAYKSFQKIQLRSADIAALTKKIQEKLADIENAEKLLTSIN